MNGDKPYCRGTKECVTIGVLVQLKDESGHSIDAIRLTYPYKVGQNQDKVLAGSKVIRDNLVKHIDNIQDLLAIK